MKVGFWNSTSAGRPVLAVVVILLALQRRWTSDTRVRIRHLPVVARMERWSSASTAAQRKGLVEDRRAVESLGLGRAMCAPATELAAAAAAVVVAAAAAAAGLAAEDRFVPCNAEPIPNLYLPDCLHQSPQKPLGPCTGEHRPAATLGAWSARFCAAPASSFPGGSSLLPVSDDPLPTLPATNSALTRPHPATAKERPEAAPKAGSSTAARAPGSAASWPQEAVNRDGVCSSFGEDYLVEAEARQHSQRPETDKRQRRKDTVEVNTHGRCCQSPSVAWD